MPDEIDSIHLSSGFLMSQNGKKSPWPVVHKRTIQTERPPLLGEVSANFSGYRLSRGQRGR
jgi:hypothetical protein